MVAYRILNGKKIKLSPEEEALISEDNASDPYTSYIEELTEWRGRQPKAETTMERLCSVVQSLAKREQASEDDLRAAEEYLAWAKSRPKEPQQ